MYVYIYIPIIFPIIFPDLIKIYMIFKYNGNMMGSFPIYMIYFPIKIYISSSNPHPIALSCHGATRLGAGAGALAPGLHAGAAAAAADARCGKPREFLGNRTKCWVEQRKMVFLLGKHRRFCQKNMVSFMDKWWNMRIVHQEKWWFIISSVFPWCLCYLECLGIVFWTILVDTLFFHAQKMTSHDPKSESEDLDLGRPETCSRMTFYAVSFNTTIICVYSTWNVSC